MADELRSKNEPEAPAAGVSPGEAGGDRLSSDDGVRPASDDELALPDDEELIEKASGRHRPTLVALPAPNADSPGDPLSSPQEPPLAELLESPQAGLESVESKPAWGELEPLDSKPRQELTKEFWRPTRFETVAGVLSFSVAVLVALVLRIKDLGIKPLHNDEGVNGWFLHRLIGEGLYAYDPTNYHGPFLYFFGWIPLLTDPLSPVMLRLPQALTGAACLLLLIPLRRRLSWAGLCATAWLMALGPLQVYYSRHAIHEIYVVFFTLLAVVAFERYAERRGEWLDEQGNPRLGADWSARSKLLTLGACALALIYANKETAIITYVALGAGLVLARPTWPHPLVRLAKAEVGQRQRWWWTQAGPMFALATLLAFVLAGLLVGVAGRVAVFGQDSGNAWAVWSTAGEALTVGSDWKAAIVMALGLVGGVALLAGAPARLVREWLRAEPLQRRGWWIALGAAVLVHVVLFTSLFSSPRGLIDWATSLYHWVARGVASEKTGHEGKVIYYYLQLIWDYEAPLVAFSGLGWLISCFRRRPFDLFVMGWGMTVITVYSALGYKTPWLVINLTLPLLLSAGIGLHGLVSGLAWLAGRSEHTAARLAPSAASGVLCLLLPALPWAPNPPPLVDPVGQNATGACPWWWLLWDTNWRGHDDNDYEIIYGQTDRDVLLLVEEVLPHLKAGEHLSIMSNDYWPLPFYLRGQGVGYPDAPAILDRLLIVSSSQEQELGNRVRNWGRATYDLRPGLPLILLTHPELGR